MRRWRRLGGAEGALRPRAELRGESPEGVWHHGEVVEEDVGWRGPWQPQWIRLGLREAHVGRSELGVAAARSAGIRHHLPPRSPRVEVAPRLTKDV